MRKTLLALAVAGAVAAGGCSAAKSPPDPRVDAVQADLDGLVASGVAGAQATMTVDGHNRVLRSGVANKDTGEPIASRSQFRIGSVTKTFTAAMLLQLVGEGRLLLDEPIEMYLPGIIRGGGIDGNAITVRQILQHRSGLPEVTDDPRIDELQAAKDNRTMTPTEALGIALSYPAQFAPNARFRYTNTNFIVAGVLVERITGNSYTDELQRRILEPAGLADTYLPGPGETEIRGPHPVGYQKLDGEVADVSQIEPSIPWAAGGMVSTGADLNRFFTLLADGKIVAPAQLTEMERADEGGIEDVGMGYGLGLGIKQLSCGIRYIGHGGGIPGYYTVSGATEDGRASTVFLTQAPENEFDANDLVEHAFCG
ncbi:beta-lactamase family protein [Antrihabitans sp. YC3-6]|uniref:Beta-lactamase family protein n=1 Tax=Antrihabitans stalagmiti TaxID=2799499 RepID=A0A934NTE5_9NOCA|nr:serine hydrolase domain-containing protein [Antrihabitans stalagmiti]MBJ8341091.1 beta-lactamase family protein [Antrihabitans stalagmiti]